MYAKIIKNGIILDGSGAKPFKGDLAVENGKIVKIGNLSDQKAQEIVDAQGKYVAPGFIDIQNHSDVYWCLFDNPTLDSLTAQGITTILVGNCGASLAPLLSREALLSIQKWHNLEGINFNWVTFSEYLEELSKHTYGTNVASLVGYSTIRRGLVGNETRALTPEEFRIVAEHLKQSLDAGAFGISSGLSYAHEAIVPETELLEVAKMIKDRDALFSIHLRSEAGEVTEALAEALDLASQLKLNLKISHFKVRNSWNWHLLPHALNQIEESYQRSGGVHFDLYPYTFTWQVLYTYLPHWASEGGRDVLLQNLKDPIIRRKILDYLKSKNRNYSEIYIASTSIPLNVSGKNLGEIAQRHNITSEEALLTIIENGGSEVMVFEESLDPKQVEQLLAHPLSMVSSDGAGFGKERVDRLVHARCFGTMPKFLNLVLQNKICTLEDAVKKITSVPANKIGLQNRGQIKLDYHADLVIFGDNVSCAANQKNPYQKPIGIEYVFVNGGLTYFKGQSTGTTFGEILKKK